MGQFVRLFAEEEGAEITEVALVIVVLAAAFLAGAPTLNQALTAAFAKITGAVSTNTSALP